MHDPMTVLFEIRRPWPQRSGWRQARNGNWFFGGIVPMPDATWSPRQLTVEEIEDGFHQWGKWRWRLRMFIGTPFWLWARKQWYFPPLITIWHIDRNEYGDDDSCRRGIRTAQVAVHEGLSSLSKHRGERRSTKQLHRIHSILWWLFCHYHWFHPHHWRVQIHPLQKLRRKLLTRCTGCGKRFRYGYAPVSGCGGAPNRRWFQGELGLFHFDCYSSTVKPAVDQPDEVTA
jgi:hypothetical protein